MAAVTGDRDPYDHDAVEIGLLVGEARGLDPLELTDDEWYREKELLAERLGKHRPLGFAPWREQQP